jgi:hypothetical protein
MEKKSIIYIVAIIAMVASILAASYSVISARFAELESTLNMQAVQLDMFKQEMAEQITDLNTRLPIQQYDYLVYHCEDNAYIYVAKNGQTGTVDFNSTDAALVFNYALEHGNSVYVKSGYYDLYSNVTCYNKRNSRLDGEGATLFCNGHKIIISGHSYEDSQNNRISGFIIFNGTVRLENSCKTIVTDMKFVSCLVGLELANTYLWSECNKIDDAHFIECTQGIVFRSPTELATGSYANALISRCYFNLRDNSIAITVEPQAQFNDCQMLNVRIWIGGYGGQEYNQTGLLVSGSMAQSVMDGVVFESFAKGNLTDAAVYAVDIDTIYQTPILQPGVTFLGPWTEMIHNPGNNDVQGEGASVAFKRENVNVPVSTSSTYSNEPTTIDVAPSTIASFKVLVKVYGDFSQNENLTVRFRLGFFDKDVAAGSEIVEKTFNSTTSLWLSDDDLLMLLPTQDLVRAILVEAKVDSASTDVYVRIYVFGTTTWSDM